MVGPTPEASFEPYRTVSANPEDSSQQTFACQLKGLRQRFGVKQLWLANALGCTDAAVSFWETGKRLPQFHILERMVSKLGEMGATPNELVTLYGSWREEKMRAVLGSCDPSRR